MKPICGGPYSILGEDLAGAVTGADVIYYVIGDNLRGIRIKSQVGYATYKKED